METALDAAARAEAAAQETYIGNGAFNTEAAFSLTENKPIGSAITIPIYYYPGRNMLSVYYAGVNCFRSDIGNAKYSYQEVGDDLNILSNQTYFLYFYSSSFLKNDYICVQ